MSRLDPYQVEQLKEIGTSLRQKRQEKGWSLDEVKVKTYIPLRVLQALEETQVEQLPEPVFIQGLVKRYADILGLDSTTLARSFSVSPDFVPPSLELRGTALPARLTLGGLPTKLNSQWSALPKLLFWAAPALLLLGVIGVGVVPSIHRNLTTRGSKPKRVVSPQPTAALVVPPTPAKTAPVQVTVKLTGDSWMEVTIDGKKAYEGVLPQGTERTWTAQKKIALEAGNAGAVQIALNGGKAKRLGKLGEVKRVNFTPVKPKSTAQAPG